jgi:hypothetical protein
MANLLQQIWKGRSNNYQAIHDINNLNRAYTHLPELMLSGLLQAEKEENVVPCICT